VRTTVAVRAHTWRRRDPVWRWGRRRARSGSSTSCLLPAFLAEYLDINTQGVHVSHQPPYYSFGLSATSQQYFSLRTNQPPATSQQYFSLRTNQHQPSATSQTNRLLMSSSSSLTAVQATSSMECRCRALRLLLSRGKHVICLSLECLSLLEIPFFFFSGMPLIGGDLVFSLSLRCTVRTMQTVFCVSNLQYVVGVSLTM
jgi:hypothetical protein